MFAVHKGGKSFVSTPPGFKEIKIKLMPQKIDKKWAIDSELGTIEEGKASVYFLASPTNTALSVGIMMFTAGLMVHNLFYDSPWKEYSILSPQGIVAGALSLPFHSAQDVYNMTGGVASVNLINPKNNYRVEEVEF